MKREKVWLIRYFDSVDSDFFRLFTTWEALLESLSLPEQNQHPAWQHPFEVWQLDFETCGMQEVSLEVLKVVEDRRKHPPDPWKHNEQNPTMLY